MSERQHGIWGVIIAMIKLHTANRDHDTSVSPAPSPNQHNDTIHTEQVYPLKRKYNADTLVSAKEKKRAKKKMGAPSEMGKGATVVSATMLPAYCLGSELLWQPAGLLCDQVLLRRLDALQVHYNYDRTGHQHNTDTAGPSSKMDRADDSDTGERVM